MTVSELITRLQELQLQFQRQNLPVSIDVDVSKLDVNEHLKEVEQVEVQELDETGPIRHVVVLS
jgi:hypothetical protein